VLIVLGVIGMLVLGCCGGLIGVGWYFVKPTSFPEQTEDYAVARKAYKTKLVNPAPAPQPWNEQPLPPDAQEITFKSSDLKLKAWVGPRAGPKKPGVLFLHNGFAFGDDDWEQSRPFRDAGFVVLTPMLRGENGQPGSYSMFYDEVDDALAAADALAARPNVDPNRIYVAGHSTGGTIALLAALTSKRFLAAATFSGSPDQVKWAQDQQFVIPFNPNDQREYQMRSPLAFPKSFKCPTRLYYGDEEIFFMFSTPALARKAKANGQDVEAVEVPGDHMSMVDPAMRQAIQFFQQK
jgi:dipeptidyl aminopeptidase/acylaminoacyl peptidase